MVRVIHHRTYDSAIRELVKYAKIGRRVGLRRNREGGWDVYVFS